MTWLLMKRNNFFYFISPQIKINTNFRDKTKIKMSHDNEFTEQCNNNINKDHILRKSTTLNTEFILLII